MSEQTVRKIIAAKLYERLSSKRIERNREVLQQASRAQILFLENLQFISETIDKVSERTVGEQKIEAKIQKELLDKLGSVLEKISNPANLEKARNIAREAQAAFLKTVQVEEGTTATAETFLIKIGLDTRDKITYDKVLAGTAFIIRNFRKVGELKRQILEAVLNEPERSADISNVIKQLSLYIDRGHGVTGASVAYSSLAAAAGEGTPEDISEQLNIFKSDQFKKYLAEGFETAKIAVTTDELNDIAKVIVKYQSIIGPDGEFIASYVPYIDFQDFYGNRGPDSAREKEVLRLARNFLSLIVTDEKETLLNIEGSPSLARKIGSVVITKFTSIKTTKNFKVKAKIDKKYILSRKSLSTKNTTKPVKGKKFSGAKTVKNKKKSVRLPTVTRTKKKSVSSGFNQLQLIGMLNSKLPEMVRRNMQYPSLQNITGTFSESVRVMNIDTTEKGFPSIAYTYDKLPYQIFEVGMGRAPWATAERDPRKLIDRSIRELATEYMTGRFYTRRV